MTVPHVASRAEAASEGSSPRSVQAFPPVLPTAILFFLFAAVPALAAGQKPARETAIAMEMVRIPAGEFDMGSNEGGDNEMPVHRVRISEFRLGKTEVTVGQFRRFVEATGYRTDAETEGDCWTVDAFGNWGRQAGRNWRDPGFSQGEDHPVVCVSWNDAEAFSDWAGLRLPTEAEWEYAAGNGARHTKFSWGDGQPVGRRGGNVADESAKRRWGRWKIFTGYDDGFQTTAPVCSFEQNDFGLCDMTGNAWEWVSDRYGATYYAESPRDNPPGPSSGTIRAYRGGGFYYEPRFVRVANRGKNPPDFRIASLGFRLASAPDQR